MTTIDAQLATLADLQRRLAAMEAEHTAHRLAAMPATVRTRLAQLDAYYAADLDTLTRQIAAQTTQVKAAVLAHGHTVQGHGLQAVFVHGRVAWDDRALEGYAAAGHQEILAFRSAGSPSVSLRRVPEAAAV